METSRGRFDDGIFVYEATQRLFSSLRIEEALHALVLYLKDYLPLDMINAGVTDGTPNTLRYLAMANTAAGYLVDERVLLSPLAMGDGRHYRLGSVKIDNCVSSSHVVQEALAHFLSTGFDFYRIPIDEGYSTMTLAIDLGKPRAAYVNLGVGGRNRYTEEHKERLMLLERPFTGAILNLIHHREILSRNETLEKVNADLKSRLGHTSMKHIIGARTGLKTALENVRQVAPIDSPVLISGETGTGKELVAHAIHGMSSRAGKAIVCINCGAIPESLVESELFGYEKGAFTGAVDRKRGYFEQADGGTVFLDEIAELPAPVQVKLLRVLQEKSFYRVGGQRQVNVDVRIIAATHRNLANMVANGAFRSDLWFRLNVFPIHLPPLRERKEDIPDMAGYFATLKAKEMNLSFMPAFAPGAMDRLKAYPWPGNIRELQNLIERSLIICSGAPMDFPDLAGPVPGDTGRGPSSTENGPFIKLHDLVAGHIKTALKRSGRQIEGRGGAAEMLGIHPSTLRGKMRKYKIE